MQRQSTMLLRDKGFSLVELMIVVLIIGLLAAIVFPQYQKYMFKSRRAEARTLLTQIAGRQEQFFVDNRRYTDDFTQLGYPAPDSVTSDNGYYTVTIEAGDFDPAAPYTYMLTATSGGIQASDECATLTIDQDNVKGYTPHIDGTAVADCW